MVYHTKLKFDKTLDKYRARVVVKGFQQTTSLYYKETTNLIVKPTTIGIVVAIIYS